jgi:hypothetical protein
MKMNSKIEELINNSCYDVVNANSNKVEKGLLIKDIKKLAQAIQVELKGTPQQNGYLHVLINYMACIMGHSTSYTKEQFRRACQVYHRYEGEELYSVSTSELTKKEKSEVIDWIRNLASLELGVYLPTPEDYYNSPEIMEEFRKEIESARSYL